MNVQDQALVAAVGTSRQAGHENYRGDHLLVAQMVSVVRGLLESVAAKVICCGCSKPRVDGRGIELSREGVNRCVARGLAVIQGDADTDLVNYPDEFLRLCDPGRKRCRRRGNRGSCSSICCASAVVRSCHSEFRSLEDAAAIAGQGPDAAHR